MADNLSLLQKLARSWPRRRETQAEPRKVFTPCDIRTHPRLVPSVSAETHAT